MAYSNAMGKAILQIFSYNALFPFLSGDKRMDYERTLKTPSLERAVSSWPTIWHFPVEVASSIESVLCNSLVRKLQNAGNSESKLISFFFFFNDSSWFKEIHWTWFPSWNLLPKTLLEIFQLRNKSLHMWWWLSSWSKKGLLRRSCDTQKWTVHLCCRPRLWILPRVALFLTPDITGVATGANSVHSGNNTMKGYLGSMLVG